MYAVKNAELALRCGYTGVASAGALHRIDVTIRDMVNEGVIPGPRMAASGRDICATSGMLDWNPSFWKLGMDGLSIFADGVDEVRKAVRAEHQRGRDVIKLYVTGEGLLRPGVPPEETMYSFEEIAVAVDEAHKRNRQVAAHVRGNDGVKLCVEAGVDVLEHATYADDEAIEMIAERKDDLFVVPGPRLPLGHPRRRASTCGIPPDVHGGDGVPGGVGARLRGDEEAARRPASASSRAATTASCGARTASTRRTSSCSSPTWASRRWRRSSRPRSTAPSCCAWSTECGTIEEGKCADMLVVDGDPLDDIAILQDRSKLTMVMKDGKVMVNTPRPAAGAAPTSPTS